MTRSLVSRDGRETPGGPHTRAFRTLRALPKGGLLLAATAETPDAAVAERTRDLS
jgi:hypothetical protein